MVLEYSMFPDMTEVGVDEVGRGCWAGPVVAAAVIWGSVGMKDHLIKDSKKLSAKMKNELDTYIKENAVAWAIAFIDNNEIDKKNILNATYDAMHACLGDVYAKKPFDHILVDGNRFMPFGVSHNHIKHTCIIKGDDKYISIAAASIIAKVARDKYMADLAKDEKYAMYKWEKNVGYGTAAHIHAIQEHGLCEYHRKSFKICGASKMT
jgi:ribonuclease HII